VVAYALYHRLESSEPAAPSPDAAREPVTRVTPSYAAFVMSGNRRRVVVIPLGPAGEIETLVSRWGDETVRGAQSTPGSIESLERAYREAGGALRRRIWDPVSARLDRGVQQVFVVPDGALNLVTLAALPMSDGRYLVEHRRFHYLSAERDLANLTDGGALDGGLLALGDPDFGGGAGTASPEAFRGARTACADFRSLKFTDLPGTAREIDELAELWTSSRDEPGGAGATILRGSAATEREFKERVAGHRIVHLATHGFFVGDRCVSGLESSRGIGGLAEGPEETRPPAVAFENPLLLSGLALAGANRREAAEPGEDDGILTAEEIATLDLSGVEWSVLSACDTGVGEVRPGEGVLGLRRAFRVAGARSLIMSLWSVEDESTRRWMKALYEARLERGVSTSAAVSEASLQILRWRRRNHRSAHPFFWAGFVATGDWR
jgi:CHAT domain-containing protein